MNKKNIFTNTIYNMLASILPVTFLQLLVYPIMSRRMDIESYGKVIATIGFMLLIIQVSGIGINNAKIILNKDYEEKNIKGDFNLIALFIMLLNIFVTICSLLILNQNLISFESAFMVLFVELGFLNIYLSAEFNIKLRFDDILKGNMFLILGYFFGLLLFILTDKWSFIFLFGMLFIVIFELRKTNYWKLGFSKTVMFPDTIKRVVLISFSSLMISIIVYADRLFLYPLLGPSTVAIYYTAAQFGKLISMGLGPISSVVLSFFSKEKELSILNFWKFNLLNFSSCFIFFIISLFFSKPVTALLYPDLALEVEQYIQIANLAAILTASGGLIQPIILKFSSLKSQLVLQIVHIITYIVFGYFMTINWGLLGFCYSNVIVAIIRIILLCVVGTNSLFNNNRGGL